MESIGIAKTVRIETLGWPEKKAIKKIREWDLTRVRKLLIRDHGIASAEAAQRIAEYRKFMAINAEFPLAHHPISKQIDDVWHCHVLDTVDYEKFCDAVFGKFVHHNPVFTKKAQRALARNYAQNTLPHLRILFGEPSRRHWLNVRRICWGEGGGGNCN